MKRQRTVKGKVRTELTFAVTCPICNQSRWLKKYDAEKARRNNSPCFRCSQSLKGKKGYQKQSPSQRKKTIERQAARMRENPTSWERHVAGILSDLNCFYEDQVVLWHSGKACIVDFKVGNKVIEVDGYHHPDRAASQAWREQVITHHHNCALLRITDLAAAFDQITQFLQEQHYAI